MALHFTIKRGWCGRYAVWVYGPISEGTVWLASFRYREDAQRFIKSMS